MTNSKLAVILVTVEGYFTIEKVVNELKKQDRAKELELIIVTTTEDQLSLKEDLNPFFGVVKIIALGTIELKDQAMAAAIRVADSPAIVLGEDHAYPQPGWADALIEAHQDNWAGVSPAINNANPGSMLSWANYLMSYGTWFEPQSKVTEAVPIHNGTYKTKVLMEFDNDLEELVNRDSNINGLILQKGHQLYLESRAAVDHLNVSNWRSTFSLRFNAGRSFAANRSQKEQWGLGKKIVYSLFSPLFPFLRLRVVWPYLQKASKKQLLFPKIIPALTYALIAHSVGEAVGYLFGGGIMTRRMLMDFEYNRFPHLNKKDQQLFGKS